MPDRKKRVPSKLHAKKETANSFDLAVKKLKTFLGWRDESGRIYGGRDRLKIQENKREKKNDQYESVYESDQYDNDSQLNTYENSSSLENSIDLISRPVPELRPTPAPAPAPATESANESVKELNVNPKKGWIPLVIAIVSIIVVGSIAFILYWTKYIMPDSNFQKSLAVNNAGNNNNDNAGYSVETKETRAVHTPTSTPTPIPTPTPVAFVSDPVDLGDWVTDISSSTIDDESYGYNYYPGQIMDGDLDTSWAEGVDDNGVGEYIVFSIPEGTVISGLIVHTGYCKNEGVFYNNSAPTVIDVYSGTSGYRIDLNSAENGYSADNYDVACEGVYVTFPVPIISNGELKITIVEARDGEKWSDTNISEIRLMGAPASD